MAIPNPILNEIISSKKVEQADGTHLKLTSALSLEECEALYRVLRERKPKRVIEIGMAYGVSGLTILTALEENGEGTLTSVDPYPGWESARKAALHNIERAGLSARHTHIHDASERVLPKLCADGERADFVHIDGHHGFDHAFIDFFYADLLVNVGGIIAFDDSGWRSVNKVIRYLLRHRKYQELDVGLPREYRGKNPLVTLIKRLEGRFGTSRHFEKIDAWAAPFNYHKNF